MTRFEKLRVVLHVCLCHYRCCVAFSLLLCILFISSLPVSGEIKMHLIIAFFSTGRT